MNYKDLLKLANDKATEAEAIAEGDEFDQEKFDALIAEAEGYRKRAESVKSAQTLRESTKAEPEPEPKAKREQPIVVTQDRADNELKAHPYKGLGELLMEVRDAALGRPSQRVLPLRSNDPEDEYGFSLNKALGDEFVGGLAKAALKAPTGLGEGLGATGGFLVDTDRQGGIMQRVYDVGQLLRRVDMTGISAGSNGMTFNAINETSRADGSRRGGIQVYWLAEAASKTASAPAFRQMELKLKKVAGLVYATDELLQDAAALESWIMSNLPEELNFAVEDAILNGTGTGQPTGIIGSNAVVSVTKETGQAADTIVAENIFNMWSRMWAPSRRNAIWLINQDVEPQLFQLSLGVGTGGSVLYWPPGGLNSAPYATLMGRPVIAHESMPTLGDTGDIMLVDPREYQMIEKGGIQTASSIHVNFTSDETVFRFVYRVDGQPKWNAALTPKSGSGNTLSPFVKLNERA